MGNSGLNSTSTFTINQGTNGFYDFPDINNDLIIDIPVFREKCKCPNKKHTDGCSIKPDGEFCVYCEKGCLKRINAVHIKV